MTAIDPKCRTCRKPRAAGAKAKTGLCRKCAAGVATVSRRKVSVARSAYLQREKARTWQDEAPVRAWEFGGDSRAAKAVRSKKWIEPVGRPDIRGPVKIGTVVLPWGKVAAVGWDGERYYMLIDERGTVSKVPAAELEARAA
jgi:hypothetical protein